MSYVKDINIHIVGQVDGEGNAYDMCMAELRLIIAKYDLREDSI